MSGEINNFDVLKRMGQENKDIRLCTTITEMNYSAKKGGTEVSVGVPGNICFDVNSGKLQCVLLLFNQAEFATVKEQMKRDAVGEGIGQAMEDRQG